VLPNYCHLIYLNIYSFQAKSQTFKPLCLRHYCHSIIPSLIFFPINSNPKNVQQSWTHSNDNFLWGNTAIHLAFAALKSTCSALVAIGLNRGTVYMWKLELPRDQSIQLLIALQDPQESAANLTPYSPYRFYHPLTLDSVSRLREAVPLHNGLSITKNTSELCQSYVTYLTVISAGKALSHNSFNV